jgi:dienelactone hydrolase
MLSSDRTFDFNLLRWHGLAPYRGTDIAEVHDVAGRIVPGDFESWHREFLALAQQVEQEGRGGSWSSPATLRDRAFRAASYYRAADFFLHGNPDDPRIMETWASATEQFDRAISLMAPAGERVAIEADGFTVPGVFFPAERDGTPRPTVLMFNGFDGSQEEMLHLCGIAALERGFNVLTFEGPGQPTVLRDQGLGFRHDWEQVVTPVVDHCEAVSEIDASQLGLIGVSFGGNLAPRAAAFEPRIGAVVTIDGLFDGYESVRALLTPELKTLLDAEDAEGFNAAMYAAMEAETGLRWYMEHGLWCSACRPRTTSTSPPAPTRWRGSLSGSAVRSWCAMPPTTTSIPGRPRRWPRHWATWRPCGRSRPRNPPAPTRIPAPRS